MKQKRNFWPQGIVASILLIICACAYTIKIAMDNPVQMDSSYMSKYQNVDENINEILRAQKAFDEHFIVKLDEKRLKIGINDISLKITDKNNNAISDANIEFLLTRPDSEDFDIKPITINDNNGIYNFKDINIDKIGRWQIIAKITIANQYGYYKNEMLATQ